MMKKFPIFTIVCKVLVSLTIIGIIVGGFGMLVSIGCAGCVGAGCTSLALPGLSSGGK